jgi:hypothetical protein
MRAAETVWAAYRRLFDNLAAFLPIAFAWVFVTALPGLAALRTADAKLPEGSDTTLLAMAPILLAVLLSMAASVCLAIVWYRAVIQGEPTQRMFPTSTDVIAPYVTRLLVASLPTVLLSMLILWISWENESPLQGAAIYIASSLIFAATARFLLVLPASATGDNATTARQSWHATQSQGLALFGGLLACDLPLTGVIVAVDYLTFDYDPNSFEGIGAFAVTQTLDLARNAIWTSFMAFAYLEFIRPVEAQADHFR